MGTRLLAVFPCLLLLCGYVQAQHGFHGSMWDFEDYTHHACNRPCEYMSPPRLCKYRWTLETYMTMSKACRQCPFVEADCFRPECISAGGVERGMMSINRRLPGPAIEVCHGDTIEITLINDLQNGEATSIHWHGLNQRGTPYMDGVSRLTQCGIQYGTTFVYRFTASEAGTQFYHGHTGMQRSDGLFGSFIIRQPPQTEPQIGLYDHDLSEHVIVLTDWLVETTVERYLDHHHDDGDNKPAMMLINGLGPYQEFLDVNNTVVRTPLPTFTVEPGQRYRFRVINAAILNCPIQVSVDQHPLMMIASDGGAFEHYTTDSFIIFGGERYDFVLYASRTATLRNYWFRASGLGDCSVKEAFQVANIKYAGAPDVLPPEPAGYQDGIKTGTIFNPWNHVADDDHIPITQMKAVLPDGNDSSVMTDTPDKKFYVAMDFIKVSTFKYNNPDRYPISDLERPYHIYPPQVNLISSSLPASPPLSQFADTPLDEYCNEFTIQKDCRQEWCHCIHKIDVDLGDLVELIVIDEGVTFNANHPMHLHGYKFRVVGMEKLGLSTSKALIKEMDRRGELNRTTTKAPLKDTVTVPDGGYTILRFRADNPGLWFFHCHIEYHADLGMGFVIQVGGLSDFPPVPRNFPRCGSFTNDDSHDDDDDDHDHDHQSGDVPEHTHPDQKVVVQCVTGGAESSVAGSPWRVMLIVAMVIGLAFRQSW